MRKAGLILKLFPIKHKYRRPNYVYVNYILEYKTPHTSHHKYYMTPISLILVLQFLKSTPMIIMLAILLQNHNETVSYCSVLLWHNQMLQALLFSRNVESNNPTSISQSENWYLLSEFNMKSDQRYFEIKWPKLWLWS